MKNSAKIIVGVAGGLAVAGLGFVAVKAMRTRGTPSPDVAGGTIRPPSSISTPVTNYVPAPAPAATPAPTSNTPTWVNNVQGALSIANNIFQTGLGFAKQLGAF